MNNTDKPKLAQGWIRGFYTEKPEYGMRVTELPPAGWAVDSLGEVFRLPVDGECLLSDLAVMTADKAHTQFILHVGGSRVSFEALFTRRKPEVDWSKVKPGTMIEVEYGGNWEKREFVGFSRGMVLAWAQANSYVNPWETDRCRLAQEVRE